MTSSEKLLIYYEVVGHERVLVVRYKSHNVYLIGSSHTDYRYVLIVKHVIKSINPEVVGIELCKTRIGYKHTVSTHSELFTEFDFEDIPENKKESAIGEKLRLLYAYGAIQYSESKRFRIRLQKYKQMRKFKLVNPIRAGNITIGAELYVPFKNLIWRSDLMGSNYLTNTFTQYKILLLDRPVEDTYRLMAEALTDKEKTLVKLYKRDFSSHFLSNSHEKESIMAWLWRRNPRLRDVFIDQRDEHMAQAIFTAITKDNVSKLVCVVGRSHIDGMLKHLKIKFRSK